MYFNGQKFSGICHRTVLFWVKDAKIDILKPKRALSVVIIELTCRCLQTGLADLKKQQHQTLEILLRVDLLRIFFKISHFPRVLEIHQ